MPRIAILACALSALAGSVLAQPRPPGGPPPGPGPQPGAGLFISPAGEPFRGPDGRAAWFARADRDGDGALTLGEFRTDALAFFKRLDANGDGRIDNFENQTYEQKVAPEITRLDFDRDPDAPHASPMGGEDQATLIRRRGAGQGGGPPRTQREGAARFGLLNEPQPVRGADGDLDGRVSVEEWGRAAGRRFAILDKAGAGALTLAALPEAPNQAPRRPAR